MFDNTKNVWSVKELQEQLSIGRNTAYALVNSKEIRSFRVKSKIRIPKQSVIDFINKNEYNSTCNDGVTPLSGKEKR